MPTRFASNVKSIELPTTEPSFEGLESRRSSISYDPSSNTFKEIPLASPKIQTTTINALHDLEEASLDDTEHQVSRILEEAAKAATLGERHHFEFFLIIIGGSLLSFNAGFINGCVIILAKFTVGHVTGTISNSGIAIAHEDFEKFLICFTVVLCFMTGSAITGALVCDPSFKMSTNYGPLFVLGGIFFLVSSITAVQYPSSNLFLYFAAMGCGLQNAITSKYSGNIVRTTHMTGSATDVGFVFGRFLMGDTKELWKIKMLLPLMLSFGLGSFFSVGTVRKFESYSLMISVGVYIFIGLLYSIIVYNKFHIPIWQTLFGFYVHHIQLGWKKYFKK